MVDRVGKTGNFGIVKLSVDFATNCTHHHIVLFLSQNLYIIMFFRINNITVMLRTFYVCLNGSILQMRPVPLVEQELPTLPEHMFSPSVFSGVHVARSLFSVCVFVDRCLSLCPFSFAHCVI